MIKAGNWREELPFILDRDKLIRWMAEKDQGHRRQRGDFEPGSLEHLEHRQGALFDTRLKIAVAKTADQAAVAEAQDRLAQERLERTHNALLADAANELRRGPVLMPCGERRRRPTGLISYGRRQVGGDLTFIPHAHHAAGEMDWALRRLTVTDGTIWFDVKILDFLHLRDRELVKMVLADVRRAESAGTGDPGTEARSGAGADGGKKPPKPRDLEEWVRKQCENYGPHDRDKDGRTFLSQKKMIEDAKAAFPNNRVTETAVIRLRKKHLSLEKLPSPGPQPGPRKKK